MSPFSASGTYMCIHIYANAYVFIYTQYIENICIQYMWNIHINFLRLITSIG